MHVHDSIANNNNSNNISYRSNNSSSNNNIILNRTRQDNNGNSASVMSNLSSYQLIDDDHIDDQETINVGNLIIDLESDLEKEKIENEQANAKPTTCTITSALSSSTSSTSSSYGAKPSSSTSTITTSITTTPSTPSGKLNQKSSGNKHSSISITNNAASNNINSNISNNTTGTINSSVSISSSSNNNVNNSSSTSSNNGHLTRTVFKSSTDERGELRMRITRETKPGKSEHKIVTSPNQKSPTSSSNSNSNSSNNNNTSHANNCEDINLHDSISKPSQSSSISSTKECGTSTSIGTITEPDCLGPCEPGTSVTLEGIVWQETEGGILVVNVTWRGKTYVGALLDCTKHDWAPPRLCDSPASDIDSKAHKGVRTKRIVTRSNGIGLDEKNLLQTTGKLRNGKGRRILTSNDLASCNKRQRESDKSNENIAAQAEANTSMANVSSITNSETACVPMNIDTTPATDNESISTSNILTDKAGPNSPIMISCSEPNCSKKYKTIEALLYHQTHAHGADNDSNNAQDSSCSSSDKIKSKTTSSENDQESDQKQDSTPIENIDRQSPSLAEFIKQPDQGVKLFQVQEKRRTPSPQLTLKLSNKIAPELSPINNNNNNSALLNQEPRTSTIRNSDTDRRSSSNSNHSISNTDHNRRSPAGPRHLLPEQHGHGSNNHSSSKSSSSSSLKMSNPAPLPATTEEGMKPSGTSTGPPPAPHQANCYFNSAFMSSNFNPYGLAPYFPRPPLPVYDPLAPPTSPANAAFLRFMSNMRVPPPPDSPSRLLNPSMSKNLPFSHFKVDPGAIPVPTSQMANHSLPTMSPLTNPPLASGSPHLRMPSQVDPMLPPTSQPPFPPPVGLNPMMGLPGPANPMGPIGGPQVPSLGVVDDPLAKQFPRRFN